MKTKGVILERMDNHIVSLDIQRILISNLSTYFRRISALGRIENHIGLDNIISITRLIVQVRLDIKMELMFSFNWMQCRINSE